MATDLIQAAVGATTNEADAMPHRLLNLIPYPRLFGAGVLSGGGSLLASITNEQAMSFALAIVAIGTVLAQPLLKAYRAARDAKLEADTREFDTWDGKLSTKSAELGETKGRLKYAEERIEELEARLAEYEAKVDSYPARAAKTIKTEVARAVGEKVEAEVQPAIEHVKSRLDTVETAQASLSGDNLPAS